MRYRPGKLLVTALVPVAALVPLACASDDSSSSTTAAPASTTSETSSTTSETSSNTEAPPTSSPGGEDFDTCMEENPSDLQLSDVHAIEDGNFSGVSDEGLLAYMEATGECGISTTEVDVSEEDKDCMLSAWESTVATTEELAPVVQAFDSVDTESTEGNEFVDRFSAEVSVACPEVTAQQLEAILYP